MATLARQIHEFRPAEVTDSVDVEAAWAAFERRDRTRDGRFVGAVLTTGIYCRPSCPARHPKRENVRFYADGAAARAAGAAGAEKEKRR